MSNLVWMVLPSDRYLPDEFFVWLRKKESNHFHMKWRYVVCLLQWNKVSLLSSESDEGSIDRQHQWKNIERVDYSYQLPIHSMTNDRPMKQHSTDNRIHQDHYLFSLHRWNEGSTEKWKEEDDIDLVHTLSRNHRFLTNNRLNEANWCRTCKSPIVWDFYSQQIQSMEMISILPIISSSICRHLIEELICIIESSMKTFNQQLIIHRLFRLFTLDSTIVS